MRKEVVMEILLGVMTKFWLIFSSFFGWVFGVLSVLMAFLLPLKASFIILSVIIGLDFIFGIWASYVIKKPITSSKAKATFVKALFYAVVLSVMFVIENYFGIAIIYKVLFGIACLIELYSVIANMLIIKPDMKLLKLLKVLIIDEIANKLKKSNKDINDILNEN